jgi:hypothetical protein
MSRTSFVSSDVETRCFTSLDFARDERRRVNNNMIDLFSLGLTHGLMLLAAWRLLTRRDLDEDRADAAAPRPRWGRPGA